MENNKQTALEWLVEQLKSRYGIYIERLTVTEQAKEMEKQQMIDAWDDGNDNEIRGGKYRRIIREKYYNEEYGKQ